MTPSRLKFTVDFADCDPARIVFYPRYFDWFDRGCERLFRVYGMPWPELWAKHRLVGFPIVDARANFLGPSRFGDEITVESWVSEWRGKVFVVEHRVVNRQKVTVEGREVRVWAERDPDDPDGMKAGTVAPEVIARFEAGPG